MRSLPSMKMILNEGKPRSAIYSMSVEYSSRPANHYEVALALIREPFRPSNLQSIYRR